MAKVSERTFRAVVASVLVGALALAAVVVGAALLSRSTTTSPSVSVSTRSPSRTTPTLAPTGIPVPAFRPSVIGVGLVPRGSASGETLILQFLESSIDAIRSAAGSFRITLTDNGGAGTTVAFVGTPSVEAPGSLGATVNRLAPNVLLVSIVASDPNNVELLSIRSLGISASTTAALGALEVHLDGFSGSLATGVEGTVSMSPGTVVATP